MYKLTISTSITHLINNTTVPADSDNIDYLEYLVWANTDGNTPEPVDAPTSEQVLAQLTAAIQRELDADAQAHGYDSILSLCSYATSASTKFGAEGQAGVTRRDAYWLRGHELMTEVQGGQRPVPTEAELIALMPVVEWPV
jgi:hypothetical protein